MIRYLIDSRKPDIIRKLITTTNLPINMMYELVLLDRSFVIYFGEKYWDGQILLRYEQYKIKNSKNYMYLHLYLRSRPIDSAFISQHVLSFLTNNYRYLQ